MHISNGRHAARSLAILVGATCAFWPPPSIVTGRTLTLADQGRGDATASADALSPTS